MPSKVRPPSLCAQLIIFVGMTFGWVGSYLFRVATKVGAGRGLGRQPAGQGIGPDHVTAWVCVCVGGTEHAFSVSIEGLLAAAPRRCNPPRVAGRHALGEQQTGRPARPPCLLPLADGLVTAEPPPTPACPDPRLPYTPCSK